jgi:hypothetical protein
MIYDTHHLVEKTTTLQNNMLPWMLKNQYYWFIQPYTRLLFAPPIDK